MKYPKVVKNKNYFSLKNIVNIAMFSLVYFVLKIWFTIEIMNSINCKI